jgi:phosphohistidine phosphatase
VLFQVLREAEHRRVQILGHNPGIADFAHQLLRNPPDHSRFEDYPTGATLVATFPIDNWSDLSWGSGKVVDFTVPRELLGA